MSKSQPSSKSSSAGTISVESVNDIPTALLALEDHLSDWRDEISEIEKLADPNVQVFVNMWKTRLEESLSIAAACREACQA